MTNSEESQIEDEIRSRFLVEDLQVFRNSAGIPYAIVGHNPHDRLITDRWFGGFETKQEFRQVISFICERFETGGYSYWLADLRLLNTSFFHSDDWLADVVFPRVMASGLVREAVVLPNYEGVPTDYDVVGSGSAALSKIVDGRVHGFRDIQKAKSWLYGVE